MYRCQVRTLLRTVGFAASVAAFATTAMADSPKPSAPDSKVHQISATPFWAENVRANGLMVVPGGDPEFVVEGGVRVEACAQVDNVSYDRPVGQAPYGNFIGGQFNLDEFFYADDFIPSPPSGGFPGDNVTINRVCWRGWFSDMACNGDIVSSDEWTLNFYSFGGGGLPGTLLATYQNFGATPTMTVNQGTTGLPVGTNPSIIEHSFSASLTTGLTVASAQCYYVEWFFETQRPCFYIQGLSTEVTGDPTAEGNRSLLRRNNRLFPAYSGLDFINIDVAMSIGFTDASVVLQPSNAFDGCFDRPAPLNDNITGASVISCGGPGTLFDNTYATHISAPLDPYSCRKATVDLTDYTTGDVWFRFNPMADSALVTLCGSDTAGGLAGGDSLISVFRLATPPSVNINNLFQVACSDDACGPGLSEAEVVDLNAEPNGGGNQNFYVRVSSFTPVDQGEYTITLTCPITRPANDLCTGAISIPATDYATVQGTLRTGANRTATVDGPSRACGGAGHAARGVWYRLVGQGARILLSTDQATSGALFDTEISVYCGTCNEMTNPELNAGKLLNCVAYNDDVSDTVTQSELDFCARAGQTYFILVAGFGTAAANSGDFTLLIRELDDTGGGPLLCCDPQICDAPCVFEIPQNAIRENGENTVGTALVADEPCVVNAAYNNTTQFNDACSVTPPAGEDRRYGVILEGQTMTGDLWSSRQVRDRDYILFQGLNTSTRNVTRWAFASEGPLRPRFYDWAEIVNFQTCNPFLGFVTQDLFGCPQQFDTLRIFEGSARGQDGALPGGTLGFLIFHISNGAGYPCGVNTRYWLTLVESNPITECVEVALNTTDAIPDFNELLESGPMSLPTVDGTGGNDGFVRGEPCFDADPDGPPPQFGGCPAPNPPAGCNNIRRKEGCFAATITNGEFLRAELNTSIFGKVDSKVGAQGASRDIDFYKFDINSSGDQIVRLNVRSSFAMTATVTNDDCTAGSDGLMIAATRGTCISGGAEAEDLVVLNGAGARYILSVFSTDAFVAVGSGAVFADYLCADNVASYVVTLTSEALPDCTSNPVTCPPAATETEVCPVGSTEPDDLFTTCEALADPQGVIGGDNDGCSQAVFAGDPISATNGSVCGTIFSVYLDFPDDVFLNDQDYWTFTVAAPSKLTYNLRANGPARVLVAETGAPSGIAGSRDQNGGSLCYNGNNPVRVLGGIDAGDCINNATPGVLYLTPGTYSMIVSSGTIDTGIATGDFNCSQVLSYNLSINAEPVGRCCLPSNLCVTVTASECSTAGGTGFTAGQLCGASYTANTTTPGNFVSIAAPANLVNKANFDDLDDGLAQFNMGGAFTLYGRQYSGASLFIHTNGYITFDSDSSFALFGGRSFPEGIAPNAVIAPFAHDWDLNAPGSNVYAVNVGVGNDETTTIEWNNVARHDNFNIRANFQVILDRNVAANPNDDTITFRYGTCNAQIAKLDIEPYNPLQQFTSDPTEVAAGIEDETGLNGLNAIVNAAFLTCNRQIVFTPADTACRTIPPACCPGNASKTTDGTPAGDVNFADVTSVLANFGVMGGGGAGPGDADCNGTVNFADITSVLANFGANCD